MKQVNLTVIRCIAILLFVVTSSHGQSNVDLNREIDNIFAKYNAETPGVAVAIVKQGKVIFKKGYGSSNLEYNIPISTTTTFNIASVSKQFTAFAIYLLEEEGMLSLGDDVRKFIPELPDYGHTITIAQLLGHTSGLRDQWALLTIAGWHRSDVITTRQIIDLTISQEDLNFAPGEEFSYSNTGYTLAAAIVERITGQTMNEFCQKRIFQPLGMNNTEFYDDYTKVLKNRAYSYVWNGTDYRKKKLNYSGSGPTSLFTNVEDLAKWSNNFKEMKVGSPDLFQNFNEVTLLNDRTKSIWRIIGTDTLFHAKGQFIRDYRGVRIYTHGGHDAGFRTHLARFPDEELTLITLSNDEDYEILARGLEIVELILGDRLEDKRSIQKTKLNTPTAEKGSSWKTPLKSFEGNYRSAEAQTQYTIKEENGELYMYHLRSGQIKLTRTDERTFSGVNYFGFSINFEGTESEIVGFDIANFGVRALRFHKTDKNQK